MKRVKGHGIQYAALPYRFDGGRVRILLITSRETRRWVIPKGWPISGLRPREAAAAEAAEEAGILGAVEPAPVGSYRYLKRLRGEATAVVQVIVFPFLVERQVRAWKEQGQRGLEWLDWRKAASLVEEPSLRRLIREFGAARSTSLVARGLRSYRAWRLRLADRDNQRSFL